MTGAQYCHMSMARVIIEHKAELTYVPYVTPPSCDENAVSKTVGHPEQLLHCIAQKDTHSLVNQRNKYQES